MSDNIVSTRIKLAIKTATEWSTANPTLLQGEVGLDSTNKIIKIGDGITAWNNLESWNPDNYVTLDTIQNIDAKKTFIKQTDNEQEVIENALELSSDNVTFRYTPLSYTGHYKPSNSILEFNSSIGRINISNIRDEFKDYDNPQLTTHYISNLGDDGLMFYSTYYSGSNGKRTNTINSFIQNSGLQFLKQERTVYDSSDGTTKTANYRSILNISDGLYLQHNYDYSQSTPLTTDTAQLKDTFLSFTHGPDNLLKTSLDYSGFSIFEQGSDSSKLFQITRDSTDGTLIQGSDTTDTTLHIPSGGNGMGIGMKGTSDDTLNVGYDAKFYGDIIKHDSIKNEDLDLIQASELLVPFGTEIVANKNLNTPEFLNVGRYYCPSYSTVATLSNCPSPRSFVMNVRNITNDYTDTNNRTWIYLVREIIDLNGSRYYQYCQSGASISWTFGTWFRVNSSTNDEDGNTAHWLKANVGRQASLDFAHQYIDGRVHARLDIVSGSTSPNPFDGDGYVLTFMWDNSGSWDTQVFFPNGGGHPSIRKKQNASWSTAEKFVTTEVEKATYSNTSVKNGSAICRRQGNVVSIVATGDCPSLSANTSTEWVTLGERFRPTENQYIPVANGGVNGRFIIINTNGKVYLYSTTAFTSAQSFAFTATYIVD